MKHLFSISFWVLFVFLQTNLQGSNLQIANISNTNTTISFEISWENSWNIQNLGRDAVWVFIKTQDCNSDTKAWEHLNLSAINSDHSVGGGVLQVDAVTDGKGVFIRRSAVGGGNINTSTVTLKFATAFSATTSINFDVNGVEMVYVTEGSFIAGDGISTKTFGTSGTNNPQQINNEGALDANALAFNNDLNWANGNTHPAIIAGFPKGFAAFYCMKYEITQKQYVHFLNLLPASQQAVRTSVAPGAPAKTYALHTLSFPWVRRNYIQIKTPATGNPLSPAVYGMNRDNDNEFDETNDGANIACNYLSWNDLLAYLDWSALRPMTELEFEKACRGPVSAGPFIAGMYAWGSQNLIRAWNHSDDPSRILNPGMPNEMSATSGNGLAVYDRNENESGPYRVGFAAGTGTSREQAGATYYGIMEMSGNVAEQCFSIGRTHNDGNPSYAPTELVAQFSGVLGDGTLDANGDGNQNTWGAPLDYRQSILRGGGYINGAGELRVSSRYYLHARSVTDAGNNNRQHYIGGRGVRQY
ncbi:MAG: formylglycine-generating enzyme family protein [Bacteroidia bacterium]|nr:formylglycine-generating enzyme family protein [Bacteroidia bacterium]